ncbi:hypothetical protein EHH44_08555 [Mycolicibacter terrae]|uniref:Low molecular weight antigen MTB12-like C-terminal domain-containing protein n=2 Tax=Mycolicibacter TaxID=1073531 RepID=A0A1A2Y6A3_MYCSD|nr:MULTISPECIES: hypothetical protein [Mycolicibacter]OBH20927.1 hypothetical protein A5694_14685 [Mycolicibacter sinensis]OBI33614.1 hypothetical protein A5710_13315 [Mycolicibacter sinensis]RRR45923.1 hypothetical protein EHH44_08555 [Mycolicibacter terrae]
MSVKSLATGVAAAALIGAAGTAVSCLATVAPAAAQAPVTVFFAPLPLDPAVDVPAPEQLTDVLNTLADPGIPAAGKSHLIEGGLGPVESSLMDRKMAKAAANGKFPLAISVANIAPAGPGAATADVTASGPRMEPRSVNLMFVDQGGWKLSKTSLMTLSQMTSSN